MTTQNHPQEQHGQNDRHLETATAAAENVSQYVFSSPVEFLTTLRNVVSEQRNRDAGSMTLHDLEIYSERGSSVAGRAAAHMAVEHFSELQHLSHTSNLDMEGKTDDISIGQLNKDIRLLTNSSRADIERDRTRMLTNEITTGALTAAMGLGTVLTAPTPVAFVFGAGTVAGSASVAAQEMERRNLAQAYQERGQQDRQTILQWGHVRNER